MHQFKMASRSEEQLALAEATIAEAFEVVKGKGGTYDRAGARKLKDMEWELGELIIQVMNDRVALTDPTPLMVDVIDGELGDDYVWQEVTSSLRVVERAYGSKPTSQRLNFTEFDIKTTPREVVVEVPLEQIASGRYTPGMISEVMADTVNRYRISNVLDSIDAGVTAVADRTGKSGYVLRYTGLTEANLDNAVDGLLDEGEGATIYGRHIALAPIRQFAGWSTMGTDAALREFETRGMVGSYNGANVVSLRDRWSRRVNAHLIRADRLYMANAIKGAVHLRRNVSFLDFAEVLPAEGLFRVGTRIEDGTLVWNPYQYRILTVA